MRFGAAGEEIPRLHVPVCNTTAPVARLHPGAERPQAPGQAGADLLESSSAERDWECWGTTG